mgnify:CR=1 FL=1
MIKIDKETYIQLLTDIPNMDMVLSNWEYEIKYYIFGLFPIIIYKKESKY